MRPRLLLSAVCLASLQLCSLAQDVQARAEAMMARARHLSDIRAKNAPAFRLKATFSFVGKDLESLQGTYTEIWVSSAQWRRETVVNDFRRIEVGAPTRTWRLDNSTDVPEITNRLPDLLNVFPAAGITFEFDSITVSPGEKAEAECVTTKPGSRQERYAFCFDKKSGALLDKADPDIRPKNSTSFSCVYGIFRNFGDYLFPREMACFEDQHRMLQAKIEDITAEPSPDAALFKPPEGASEGCATKLVSPSVISQVAPSLPGTSLGLGTTDDQGTVKIEITVDAMGKPQGGIVVQSDRKRFEEAALNAISKWRFKPATCNGEPMASKIQIEFRFGS
jgi:TonB family protein